MGDGKRGGGRLQDLIPDITLKRTLSNYRKIGGRRKREEGGGGEQDLIPDITLKRTLSNSRMIGGRSKRGGGGARPST